MRSLPEIRHIVNSAKQQMDTDTEVKKNALLNPVKFLTEKPYSLNLEELKAAYDDPDLNVYHPDHPEFRNFKAYGGGCILCGKVSEDILMIDP